MTTPAEVVAEARRWIGTPFHHQGHKLGVGVDCAGLVRGVRVGLGHLRADMENEPGAREFTGYGPVPDGVAIKAACDRWLLPVAASLLSEACIVLVNWKGGRPQHLGIVAPPPPKREGLLYMIHADSLRAKRVIETRLEFGNYMRLVQVYRLPGVEYP